MRFAAFLLLLLAVAMAHAQCVDGASPQRIDIQTGTQDRSIPAALHSAAAFA